MDTIPNNLPNPFPNDRPLISLNAIERPLDRLETLAIADLLTPVKRETDRIDKLLKLKPEQLEPELRRCQTRLLNRQNAAIAGLWRKSFDFGNRHAMREMSAAIKQGGVAQFNLQQRIEEMLRMDPVQIINTPANAAMLQRALQIAGNFSSQVIQQLRNLLVASLIPSQPTGDPLPRPELESNITKLLNVSRRRSQTIARTETTYAYNGGRVATYKQTSLVTHVRFLAILDTRTTDICKTRNGMVISLQDVDRLRVSTPPLHYSCRSVLSPLLPNVNLEHAQMIADPARDPRDRTLAPLLPGWRSG